MTWSATVCGLLNIFPDIPYNHGVLRSIEVLTTPGSCVHVSFLGRSAEPARAPTRRCSPASSHASARQTLSLPAKRGHLQPDERQRFAARVQTALPG